ncbi:hypothetical protein EUTSA_v10000664mg [Eutrema salsugineum]|uniref:F-box domain-containing protein n=1 Tax=Eutrema salsugineum TaxID=72664 RepID=V4LUF1_EUTSA|nr:hypothetical protein EUTSA_v10000664mg [Eutrema salsugineum]
MSLTTIPPRKIIPPPLRSPSWFSSLPIEIVWKILAHVPKRYYPTLSCVSKNFRYLVNSPEIHRIRSLLGKDSIFICFIDETNRAQTRNWFTLRRVENHPTENQLVVSVDLVFPYDYEPNPSIIAAGPEIFFICGSFIPSSRLYIFDSRSGKLRQGPSLKLHRSSNTVGFIGNKIYAIGGYIDGVIQVESFDLKMRTWEQAPVPEEQGSWFWAASVSIDRKVCVLDVLKGIAVCYDTRDGSCESFELPKDKWWDTGVCVKDNVLYVYYARFGLMWYDTKLMLWRVVYGLNDLKKVRSVAMAEYYGKMAFLWEESRDIRSETKEIWCRMIALNRSEVGIHGTAEASKLMGSVPRGYKFHEHCLSLSD